MKRSLSSLLFYVLIFLSLTSLSLRLIGVQYSVILTDSMQPAINPFDVVVVFPSRSIEKGDVVMYRLGMEGEEYLIVHRVVAINGNHLITKGDSRDYLDPWEVSMEQVVGKVVLRLPGIGRLSLFVIRVYPFLFPLLMGALAYSIMSTYLEGSTRRHVSLRPTRTAAVVRRKKVVHYMRKKGLLLLFIMLSNYSLAAPLELDAQTIGEGLGRVVSPLSSGQVCVPYEYYYVAYIFGVPVGDGTVPIDSVGTVYPGNFSTELPEGSEIYTAFIRGGRVDSVGSVTLTSPLPAGYYVTLNLTAPLRSRNALRDELHLVVASSERVPFPGPSMVLEVQKLGTGTKTGDFRDVRIYLGRIDDGLLTYEVFLDLRCFAVSFGGSTRTLNVYRTANVMEKGDAGNLSSLELLVRRDFPPEGALRKSRR